MVCGPLQAEAEPCSAAGRHAPRAMPRNTRALLSMARFWAAVLSTVPSSVSRPPISMDALRLHHETKKVRNNMRPYSAGCAPCPTYWLASAWFRQSHGWLHSAAHQLAHQCVRNVCPVTHPCLRVSADAGGAVSRPARK